MNTPQFPPRYKSTSQLYLPKPQTQIIHHTNNQRNINKPPSILSTIKNSIVFNETNYNEILNQKRKHSTNNNPYNHYNDYNDYNDCDRKNGSKKKVITRLDDYTIPKSIIKFPHESVKLGTWIGGCIVENYLNSLEKDDCILFGNEHTFALFYQIHINESRDFKNEVLRHGNKTDFSKIHKWIIPIFCELHWLTCIVYIKENIFLFLDSKYDYKTFDELPEILRNQFICLQKFLKLYGELFNHKNFTNKWKIHFGKIIPKQQDSWSCAWYFMYIASLNKICTHELFNDECKYYNISYRQLRVFVSSFSDKI